MGWYRPGVQVTGVRPAPPPVVRDIGVLVGVLGMLVVTAFDVAASVQLTGAYSVAAILAAMLTTTRRTVALGALAVFAAALSGLWHDNLGSNEWLARLVLTVILVGLAVVSGELRHRREARLHQMTLIADTAQRAVLRALPGSVGSLGLAARYVSASAEARVGGDLYEVTETPYGVRVIVGDVRGKGLEAVQSAATVLGAFRQAAFSEPDPAALARAIDDSVARILGDEDFVTAIVAEFNGDRVTMANCGHHPPLLIHDRRAHLVDTGEETPPLGLVAQPVLTNHVWLPNNRILFYTDGLVEARNSRGTFFPLDRYGPELGEGSLEEALDRLLGHLQAFGGKDLRDDLALVLAERLPSAA